MRMGKRTQRLTARGSDGFAYFPTCFEAPCYGGGCRREDCQFIKDVCEKLCRLEEQSCEGKERKRKNEKSVL